MEGNQRFRIVRRSSGKRTQGVRHLFGELDLNRDCLDGHMKTTKNRTKFLEFSRSLRSSNSLSGRAPHTRQAPPVAVRG